MFLFFSFFFFFMSFFVFMGEETMNCQIKSPNYRPIPGFNKNLQIQNLISSVTLAHQKEKHSVPLHQIINECSLFHNNLALISAPYKIQSSVLLSLFRWFGSSVEGTAAEITDINITRIWQLPVRFGFDELSAQHSKLL
jgi:hypothetical protein